MVKHELFVKNCVYVVYWMLLIANVSERIRFPLFLSILRCRLCVGHNQAVVRMRLVAFHNRHGENPFACVASCVSLSSVHFVALVSAQADAKKNRCPLSARSTMA